MGQIVGKLTTTSHRTLLSKQTELGRKEGSRKSWGSHGKIPAPPRPAALPALTVVWRL